MVEIYYLLVTKRNYHESITLLNLVQQSIIIEIENPNFESGNMSTYDLSERLILNKTIFNRNEVVDINQLKSGEYICIIKSNDNKMFMNKFVKVQ